jgi:hypothetical protein
MNALERPVARHRHAYHAPIISGSNTGLRSRYTSAGQAISTAGVLRRHGFDEPARDSNYGAVEAMQ